MILTIARTIPARHHQALQALIGLGFEDVDHDDVEVHVRSRPPRVHWTVHYRTPVSELAPELRRQWLTSHPGSDFAPVAEAYRRRRDAAAAAEGKDSVLRRHVDERLSERMSALAYYEIPTVARVAVGIKYLVTMRIPPNLEDLAYPHQLQYRRRGVAMRRAPVVQVVDWLEELVHLAAHEARHVAQFRLGVVKSEVDAERWAAAAVERFRSSRCHTPAISSGPAG